MLVSDIVVGERARKNYGPIEDLKVSIERYGLLQPLVVDKEKRLVAGGRRLRAIKELGWTEVEVVEVGECGELRRLELELEENIQRKDFSFVEEAALIEKIHSVKQQLYGGSTQGKAGGWTQTDTAISIDKGQSYVAKQLALARAIRSMPELKDVPNKTAAVQRVQRRLQELERELAIRQQGVTDENIVCGDCLLLLDEVPANTVDCIITDPPYGIDLEMISTKYTGSHFDDSKDTFEELMEKLTPKLKRVAKESAHWYIFHNISFTEFLHKVLRKNSIIYDPFPLIWVKDTMQTGDWRRHYALNYEAITFCQGSGTRFLKNKMTSTFHWKTVVRGKKFSTVEKPVEAARTFIEQSTIEGELVLDPCCGSGFVPLAAAALGRRYLAFDLSEEAVKEAWLRRERLHEE